MRLMHYFKMKFGKKTKLPKSTIMAVNGRRLDNSFVRCEKAIGVTGGTLANSILDKPWEQ